MRSPLTGPGVVVHRIKSDKGTATFKGLIGDYKGVIVCDALKTHEAGVRGNDRVALAGCWAHVFRKFEEAAPDHPEAHLAMKWIGELYAIEDRCTHDDGPLCEGEFDAETGVVVCPRHGANFDIRTGDALTLPATQPVRVYPVRVSGGMIKVELG